MLQFKEITTEDWPLITTLFGPRGACGGCWCMSWRRESHGKAWEAVKGEPNRRAFRMLVTTGKAHGIVALDGDRPAGWCSFGRRAEFPRLDRTKAYQAIENHPGRQKYGARFAEKIWSINCLFLNKDYRRQGFAQPIVATAVDAIRRRRGRFIEAYPVTFTREGKKLPAAFSFTGPETVYRRLGFREVQRVSQSRPLYLLELA